MTTARYSESLPNACQGSLRRGRALPDPPFEKDLREEPGCTEVPAASSCYPAQVLRCRGPPANVREVRRSNYSLEPSGFGRREFSSG